MHKSPALSLIATAAAGLRGIWAAVLTRFRVFRVEPDEQAVADWVNGILSQFEALLVQFRAGQLPACGDPGADNSQYDSAGHAVRIRVADADGHASRGVLWQADACDAGVAGDAHQADSEFAVDATAKTSKTVPDAEAVSAFVAPWRDFGGASVDFFQKWLEASLIGTP